MMRPGELGAVRELSQRAFGDDPGIGELLDALHDSWAWIDELSFVAELDGELVGQVLYTRALLDAPARLVDVLVLSPVGVRPDLQRRGIGRRLITTSLDIIGARTEPLVFLEGHPGYYPRFGFEPAGRLGLIAPSLRIPADAFMAYRLPSYEPMLTGTLVYPDAFWRCDAVGLRPAPPDGRPPGIATTRTSPNRGPGIAQQPHG
jgi:putative acetyltransferase